MIVAQNKAETFALVTVVENGRRNIARAEIPDVLVTATLRYAMAVVLAFPISLPSSL
jgi:hypothetical protein